MTPGVALAMKGLCEICQAKLPHGPYTPDQIKEICADLGIEESEFSAWCDDCFVIQVGLGDVAYAQRLAKEPLVLTKPEHLAQLKHMKFMAAGKALQDFRAKHPEDYRQHPEGIALFNEFLEHAPPEVLQAFEAKAKELDLLPKTRYVDDVGEPVCSAEQIAEKLGIPVEQVEKELHEQFADRLVPSAIVHPVQ